MVVEQPTATQASLNLIVGTKPDGTPQFKKKSFSSLKPAATPASIHTVMNALGNLQAHPVHEILLTKTTRLVNS